MIVVGIAGGCQTCRFLLATAWRAAQSTWAEYNRVSFMGTLLTISSLAVHLVAMNVAAAGPLACAWLMAGKSSDSAWSQRLAHLAIAALLAGALLGGLLLVWPSNGMRTALERFPGTTYWFAGAELLFSLGCMALLAVLAHEPRRRPVWAWILAAATATNLLYHFPPLMAVIGKIAVEPKWTREAVISHRVLLQLVVRPEVISLWLHFVLASVAGAAITAFCIGGCTLSESGAGARGVVRRLAAAALVATLLQLPVGAWVLLASSAPAQDALMGQDARATSCFIAGVLLAVGLMHTLAAIAAGDTQPAARRRAAGLFAAVALLMAATLVLSRTTSVANATRPPALTSSSQAPSRPLPDLRLGKSLP